MSKYINVTAGLVFYDGVQVFDATDAIGGRYVGVLVNGEPESDCRYMVVGVSPASLQAFRFGQIDLRSLMEGRPDSDEWFTVDVEVNLSEPLKLQVRTGTIPEMYLPEEGFFLHQEIAPPHAAAIRKEAIARQRTVMELMVESQEYTGSHSIRADRFGGLLCHWQQLIRHAFAKAIQAVSEAERKLIDRRDGPLLNVAVPALEGSLRIVLVASEMPHLFGGGEIVRAFSVIDDIASVSDNPEETLNRLQKYRGFTAGSYLGLLRFILESNMSLRYAWTVPDRPDVSVHGITRRQAEPLVDALEAEEALGIERVELTGRLYEGNSKIGNWRLDADDGKSYHGWVRPNVNIDGRMLGSRYKFACEEVEEVTGTGRIKRKLYATDIIPVD